jgi:flavin-dependent dehydrogenase
MADCDALIIGAGIAGLIMARQLARSGHRVTIVDVKPDVSTRVHTTGIFVRRTLEDFALPEDCLGAPISRVALHSPAGRTFEMESTAPEFRLGRMGALYARLLSDAQHAGATFLPRTRYTGSVACESGNAVWLEKNGRRWRMRARWLVGADGARSHVARDLDLDRNTHWLIGVEEVFEGAMPDAPPTLHCFIQPSRLDTSPGLHMTACFRMWDWRVSRRGSSRAQLWSRSGSVCVASSTSPAPVDWSGEVAGSR